MKKITGLLALGAVLAAPSMGFAEPQSGFYVTPKLMYGLTDMRNAKYYETNPSTTSYNLGSQWDNTFGVSLAVGYDLSKKHNTPVRAELEYAVFTKAESTGRPDDWHPANKMRQSSYVQTLFVNAYYDIDTGGKFTPYVGAGIGAGLIQTEGDIVWFSGIRENTGSKTVTNFAWNLGIGVGYKITDKVVLDVGYRLVDLGKVKTNLYDWGGGDSWHMETGRLTQHQFGVGARVKF
ncbi:MAG: acyloxyacyl hydrolase [Alphaproteobacteria bacterium]|nr:acyloxyacyl hydrolase [Alphaproteobacteria bacterium]